MKTLKTHMPKAKPPQIILFHKDFRKGKQFPLDEAQEKYEEMKEDGWVDSPAKLDPLPEENKPAPELSESARPDEIKKAAEALGYTVLNDIELQQRDAGKVELSALSDDEVIAELTKRGITYKPSKDDVIAFCEEYGIELAVEEPLINRFFQSPTDLTKEELVVLGAEYGLKLKMTQNEATMIDLVAQAIEDSKNAPA